MELLGIVINDGILQLDEKVRQGTEQQVAVTSNRTGFVCLCQKKRRRRKKKTEKRREKKNSTNIRNADGK